MSSVMETLINLADVKNRCLSIYPQKYMDSWERFNETLLPDEKDFYSNLNIEDTKDVDYKPAKKDEKTLKKNLGEYHDLYAQSDALLLADVFKCFHNECIEIYELDPAHLLSAPWLAWQACLKNQK